jgi:cysteine-rich repeat protein
MGSCSLLDDFNRANDTDMGPNWLEPDPDFSVLANQASSDPSFAPSLMTFVGQTSNTVCVDTFINGAQIQYTALVLRYADLANNVFVKVQDNDGSGDYDTAFFHYGNNGGAWSGTYLFPLTPFTSARLLAHVDGTDVTLQIDTDFNNVADQTYTVGGLPTGSLGTGIGLGGFQAALMDDFKAVDSVCGNGSTDSGEQCDDANTNSGDCCSSTCQYEASGSPCPDDANICTDNVCDGAGTCGLNNMAACDDGIFCNGTDTCGGGMCGHSGDPCTSGPPCADVCNEAEGNCFAATGTLCPSDGNLCTKDTCDGAGNCGVLPTGCRAAGKSLLLLKQGSDDSKDKLVWKWLKGAVTSIGDLGDPTSTTNYALCMYAGTAFASVALPAGSNWQPVGMVGFKLKNTSGAPNGAQKALVKSGAAGKAKATVKGKGVNLPDALAPILPLPVTVQLVNDANSVCFEAEYGTPDVVKNDVKQFKAKK